MYTGFINHEFPSVSIDDKSSFICLYHLEFYRLLRAMISDSYREGGSTVPSDQNFGVRLYSALFALHIKLYVFSGSCVDICAEWNSVLLFMNKVLAFQLL